MPLTILIAGSTAFKKKKKNPLTLTDESHRGKQTNTSSIRVGELVFVVLKVLSQNQQYCLHLYTMIRKEVESVCICEREREHLECQKWVLQGRLFLFKKI